MGKKSRRPARQQKKLTLEDLDDDTAKPIPPLSVAEIHAQSGAFDEDAVGEYLSLVILERHRYEGIYGALRAVKKWSRVQPHWKRIRRRICWGCARQVALTEPRYLVCAGCGKARYCSEACQRLDWAEHQKKCPAGLGESNFEQMMLAAFGNDVQRAAQRPG